MSNNLQELSDVFPITFTPILNEGDKSPVKWKGTFGWADRPTTNKRNYSRKLWERIVSEEDVNTRLSRGMIGVLNHPSDGETDLFRSAIMTKKITLKESGEVEGEAYILPTAGGVVLNQLIESGAVLGVSTRGRGNVDENGNVNEDTYQLVTFDVVDNPAVSSATPKKIAESVENKIKNKTNDNIGGNPMSNVLDKYTEIEKNITPTLVAIEGGKFNSEIKESLDAVLKDAVVKAGSLTESDGGLIAPMITDLQQRIITARGILRKSPVIKESDDVKAITLDDVKPKDNPDTKPEPKNDVPPDKPANEGADDAAKSEKIDKALVEELQATIASLEKKYAEALGVIEEMKQVKEEDAIKEAIEKEVSACPQLEESRFILEKANSMEELTKFVAKLRGAEAATKNKTDDDTKLPNNKIDNTKAIAENAKTKPVKAKSKFDAVMSSVFDLNVGLTKR
jgi:hypothetical protein